MHQSCHHCGATNRVPDDRVDDGPVCARCKTKLMPTHPVPLSDARFDTYIAHTDAPVLVDFWADWCGPCKMMAPQFAQAAAQSPGVRFAKVDTEANSKAIVRNRIRSIPTLVLYQGGQERARISGALSASDLQRWLRAQLQG